MKKLMIAAAIVCAAVVSQAAGYKWSSSATGGVLYDGTADAKAYATYGAMTLYMFDAATYTQSQMFDKLSKGTDISTLTAAASTSLSTASKITTKDFDYGPGAIRCVYLGAGGTLRGLTITGGHTCYTDQPGLADSDVRGSAVYAANAGTCRIEDCIVSNNAAYMRTLNAATVVKCRVTDNVSSADDSTCSAAAGYGCRWYGCFIDRNRGQGTLQSPGCIDSCTIGENNLYTYSGTSPQVIYYYQAQVALRNCVFVGGRFYGTLMPTNCVFLGSMTGKTETAALYAGRCVNCKFMKNVSAMKLDGDLRPLADSPLVDAGDAALCEDLGNGTDLAGTPRVLNGTMDVGAYEFDWRPVYADALGRKIVVTDVSPAVSNSTEGVVIPSGELAGTIGKAGQGTATFDITGNGSLSVYVNGVLVGTYAAGTMSADLGDIEAGAAFRFVYEPGDDDPGVAVVKGLRARTGTLLIVR